MASTTPIYLRTRGRVAFGPRFQGSDQDLQPSDTESSAECDVLFFRATFTPTKRQRLGTQNHQGLAAQHPNHIQPPFRQRLRPQEKDTKTGGSEPSLPVRGGARGARAPADRAGRRLALEGPEFFHPFWRPKDGRLGWSLFTSLGLQFSEGGRGGFGGSVPTEPEDMGQEP